MDMGVYDLGIIGAGFAGLACARTAARRGLRVLVLDRKSDAGQQMHTTGLLVKEAAERWEIPAALTQRVRGIRLYSPSLASLDLAASGYYFLATDTPALMRWFAREARRAGAHLRFAQPYAGARRAGDGFELQGTGARVRYLIGADGPNSRVAAEFGLGRNTRFLLGVEAEYEGIEGVDPERLHCLLDRRLARGYIGWVVPGYRGLVQIGLACRRPDRPDLAAFERKLARLFDFSGARRVGRRGGLIPIGGPVSPMAGPGVSLIGDAAGLVSPLSAGGIHTALESGFLAAHAVADHQQEGCEDPGRALARQRPRFVVKRMLRVVFDRGIPDPVLDAALGTRAFTALARSIYFHHRGLRSAEGWRDLAQTLFRGHP
jgi:digeranylgeranylglycerophospholipid reductase